MKNTFFTVWRKTLSLFLICAFATGSAQAGLNIVRSNGITLTGADGITLTGADGITLTGADSFLNYQSNGITLTGADGITLTGADGITLTGADGATHTGTNGITLTGADGITLTGADGITLTGADGITLTGADGQTRRADSVVVRQPNGITLTGADGITLTGADGTAITGADGITLTGADGITLTGADGITLTGADGITLTGADGITLTGADGITLTGADGITLTGADTVKRLRNSTVGLQSVDPELAIAIDKATDDSNLNAVLVFHTYPTETDLNNLRQVGILGGTLYRRLPAIVVTATRAQLIAASRLTNVRSIYGNRTLNINADPYLAPTILNRAYADRDLQRHNGGLPVSGRGVTVAVLDTGVNALHGDLAGRVVQNVRLNDIQSAPVGFINPVPLENIANTDPISGHGTFVAGVVAGSGAASGGKYNGVAPGARVLGLSAGDLNLSFVLAGFDYLLEKGAQHNARVVNCSFSANTVYSEHDPVNVATRMLTQAGVNVVFSAGNTGAGNGTLNPYAVAPWVVSVGATDHLSKLAGFSSRGVFGNRQFRPSLVAPGVNLVGLRSSATQTGVLGVALGTDATRLTPAELLNYTTASGTSFSAPQVAGVIALMLQANPRLTPAQVKDILQRTATPLPAYYAHEAGAGMLNVHAAVLQSAFPTRDFGLFRAALAGNQINFRTETVQNFLGTVQPGAPSAFNAVLPGNTIQASIHLAWGGLTSINDLGLSVRDANGVLRGESNRSNLPGLSGRRERVTLNNPNFSNFQAIVANTLPVGTTQNYFGAVEATTVEYGSLSDIAALDAAAQDAVKQGLQHGLLLGEGNLYNPTATVSRADFAAAFVRTGIVPQYLAAGSLYRDVRSLTTRTVVESVQTNPKGKLFVDDFNNNFRPDEATWRLAAAIALVRAAGLEAAAQTAVLNTRDARIIPASMRGYAAVALREGLLTTNAGNFDPYKPLTKVELARAMVGLYKR